MPTFMPRYWGKVVVKTDTKITGYKVTLRSTVQGEREHPPEDNPKSIQNVFKTTVTRTKYKNSKKQKISLEGFAD